MARKIWIGSDHAGFELKESLKEYLKARGRTVVDVGTHSKDSVHYPKYAYDAVQGMLKGCTDEELLTPCAVLVCGSGVGVSIAANRTRGVRAVLALREDVAQLSREHNGSNVLCLGARLLSSDEARRILDVWLDTEFEGGRHLTRVQMMDNFSETHDVDSDD